MKIKLFVFFLSILSILPFLFLDKQVQAGKIVETSSTEVRIESKKLDRRAEILSNYLAKYDSPLQYHAQDLIDASETYQLDWRLLPAIAGVESTFGKQIPGGFNAWGWGVYGDQAIYFNSWKEGIFTIARGLRENYLNKGLTDPYSINRIYATSPYWGGRVTYFMNDLQNFASKYDAEEQKDSAVGSTPKIAAVSGQLALR